MNVLYDLAPLSLNASRLLFDLKRCGELMQRFSGCLDSAQIAACITDGLVEQFGFAFSRIWIVAPDRKTLKLTASSGLYTRLDGSFATVPMGAFKVGKIAQNCIPFLSNCLAEEAWVKDKNWAIANKIKGFAGLPLIQGEQAIGVLAVFSHEPLTAEFLETLQILSIAVTGAIASALKHQRLQESPVPSQPVLSEQVSRRLGQQKLSLLGPEKPLRTEFQQLLLQTAEQLAQLHCHYCRLIYEDQATILEAMLSTAGMQENSECPDSWFQSIRLRTEQLGGIFRLEIDAASAVGQMLLQLPQEKNRDSEPLLSPPLLPLSDREREVLLLLAQGGRDREISEQLYISERTVKFHVKNILAKLGVRTRVQAVYLSTRKGWIT